MTTTDILGHDLRKASGQPGTSGDVANPVDQLLQQATLLAKQLQRERAGLQGIGRTDGRPAVKALQQQIVQVWNAIRAARSSSGGL